MPHALGRGTFACGRDQAAQAAQAAQASVAANGLLFAKAEINEFEEIAVDCR